MSRARAKSNVVILAVCQALMNSSMTILVGLAGIVGSILATDKALATLPVSATVIGTALMTFPASMFMRHVGRRAGFMTGTTIGMIGGLIASYGIYAGDFWIFVAGCFLFGMFQAFGQYYRFAAADVADKEFKSKAISWVMAGGVVAGFLGPEIAKHTKELILPYIYLGSYIAQAFMCLASFVLVSLVSIPKLTASQRSEHQRPLSEIMRQPMFALAVLSGMIGYGTMSLIMTATPLAMVACGLVVDQALTVIQWHVVAMFAPSFVTGSLINRYGAVRVILTGVSLTSICVAINLSGIELANFWSSLVLLGIGWNFMFIGGTTLVARMHTPAETAKVQGLNDFLVFGVVATASLSSGQLLERIGWEAVNIGALPFLALVAAVALTQLFRARTVSPG